MNLYVLDTDHLTLFRFGDESVVAHVAAKSHDEIAMTIVSWKNNCEAGTP